MAETDAHKQRTYNKHTCISSTVLVKMNMTRSNVGFLDLPNEILLLIFNKLDNMDVLYSLLGTGNQRLDMIVQASMFTATLNFVLKTAMADSIFDRFCLNILPKIDRNVKSLTLASESMERILLAADFPNLTELKIPNFNQQLVSHYFTGKECLG